MNTSLLFHAVCVSRHLSHWNACDNWDLLRHCSDAIYNLVKEYFAPTMNRYCWDLIVSSIPIFKVLLNLLSCFFFTWRVSILFLLLLRSVKNLFSTQKKSEESYHALLWFLWHMSLSEPKEDQFGCSISSWDACWRCIVAVASDCKTSFQNCLSGETSDKHLVVARKKIKGKEIVSSMNHATIVYKQALIQNLVSALTFLLYYEHSLMWLPDLYCDIEFCVA